MDRIAWRQDLDGDAGCDRLVPGFYLSNKTPALAALA